MAAFTRATLLWWQAALFLLLATPRSCVAEGQIQLCVENEGGEGIEGALVECFDDDHAPNVDDPMASGETGTDGCLTMTYERKEGNGPECKEAWDGWGLDRVLMPVNDMCSIKNLLKVWQI